MDVSALQYMNELTKAKQALNLKAESIMHYQCKLAHYSTSTLMEEDNSEMYKRGFGGKQCWGSLSHHCQHEVSTCRVMFTVLERLVHILTLRSRSRWTYQASRQSNVKITSPRSLWETVILGFTGWPDNEWLTTAITVRQSAWLLL